MNAYQMIEAGVGGMTAVATLGVPAFFLLWRKVDQEVIARKKLWEQFHKESLTAAVESLQAEAAEAVQKSEENQVRMRASLHELRRGANRTGLENESLRQEMAVMREQFLAISQELRATGIDLSAANENLLQAGRALDASTSQLQRVREDLEVAKRERDNLSQEVHKLRVLIENGWHA